MKASQVYITFGRFLIAAFGDGTDYSVQCVLSECPCLYDLTKGDPIETCYNTVNKSHISK